MTEAPRLDRFVRAQAGVYATALAELHAGRKQTHWMWFIFPQILGLGKSANARAFAIVGKDEARAYLGHELLGGRLLECTQAVTALAGERTPLEIFGPIDAMKFHSSMTLFEASAPDPAPFAKALDALCKGERDAATLEKLG
ncbi:DUF1810 domain-containing protein [Aurantiacibacter poecillastricola]|uniref:DUF1810 domain-containing protein n=1 Tax=Aurantiacibacter poecillastricola TaxID=3064385 RepID=UPI00273DA640|nr:DUF1810 domain-containing protein [Aurantiacibacter sp. 219JJ12-13]MDP5263487.1 DUF1810 domain-containing protein [Aurantiacibacter sp. 219JJ12-13]